jgi:AbrB family looped-hinge helix DNA binding protein
MMVEILTSRGSKMVVQVKVDQQGRVVIPLHERERLGVAAGGTLELIPTPEGVLLEPRRPAHVRTGEDGLPVITIEDIRDVSNDESLDAIHRERERP